MVYSLNIEATSFIGTYYVIIAVHMLLLTYLKMADLSIFFFEDSTT